MSTEFLQGILLLLVIGVLFVNGWTDAPNAIASAVTTKAIRYRSAVWLAAVCNLLGILVMSWISTAVLDTITAMARFEGVHAAQSMAALCAAMASIVLFAVVAWWFGIPTSESHALIAALTGAAIALGGIHMVDKHAWGKVLWGLGLSLAMGFGLGWLFGVILKKPLARCSSRLLDRLQIISAGGMAFMHGAQDGQKFIAVLVSVDLLAKGVTNDAPLEIRQHMGVLLLCAAVMALGTSIGGKRIVETVGGKMVGDFNKSQGVSADAAGVVCLLAASLSGIPMSTTHTKTTAMMGAGLAGARRQVSFSVIAQMLLAWLITFPVCGWIGYGLTKFFLRIYTG